MKKILLVLTFLATAGISSDDCSAGHVPIGIKVDDFENYNIYVMEAKPILFIKRGLQKYSVELIEFEKNTDKWDSCTLQLYEKTKELVRQKMLIIIDDLIKKYGACALQTYREYKYDIIYIDSAYDITQEAFDRLNKEYLESKAR